ncbi:MAG: multidrug efflux pump subunit AcrB, partial [Phenylobacterium sp.]
MDLTKNALKNPSAMIIILAVIAVLGLYALKQLPVQLFPNIERPQINIQTFWRAASPKEIESEILEPQEEVLQGLPGLTSLRTNANSGGGFVNLEFSLGTDMQKTLIDVISAMNRLPPLPREVNAPQINLGGGGNALIYFFLQALPGNDIAVSDYATFFDDNIRPRIESIPGVARVLLQAGSGAEEMDIVFDPYRAAALGIELNQVSSLLGSANDVSGGTVDVGRRAYTLRFAGRYQPSQLG